MCVYAEDTRVQSGEDRLQNTCKKFGNDLHVLASYIFFSEQYHQFERVFAPLSAPLCKNSISTTSTYPFRMISVQFYRKKNTKKNTFCSCTLHFDAFLTRRSQSVFRVNNINSNLCCRRQCCTKMKYILALG